MTCRALLFAATDVRIPLQIAPDADFVIGDIVDMEITLWTVAGVSYVYQYSAGQIVIEDGQIYLLIDKTDITEPGYYRVSIRLTDPAGKTRGITPCPDILRFHS